MAHSVALLAPEGRLTTYRRRSLHSSPTQTKRAQQQAIYNRRKAEEAATAVGQQVFLQHTLTALLTGSRLRLPDFMRVELSPDGLISRIDEYYDSRATDVLAEAGL